MRVEADKFCVYTHSVNGAIFYIGQGRGSRPLETTNRNRRWRAHMAAHGGCFDVQILGWYSTKHAASAAETEAIVSHRPLANVQKVPRSTPLPVATELAGVEHTEGMSIRKARRAAKLTCEELAERVGVTRQAISGIELGAYYARRPVLRKIAAALRVPIARLIG